MHVYRQSHVPAIPQVSALLANVTSKGTLNRAHAYKALVAANTAAGRDTDHGINMGVFTYPVLMAADILAMRATRSRSVPTRPSTWRSRIELARAFARVYFDPAPSGCRGRSSRAAAACCPASTAAR